MQTAILTKKMAHEPDWWKTRLLWHRRFTASNTQYGAATEKVLIKKTVNRE